MLVSHSIWAQDYRKTTYRATDGLTNDIIKSISVDSEGFLWAGSDNGLIRFNGVNFEPFPDATASNFIKEIYKSKEERLFVLSDMDMVEIVYDSGKVKFNTLLTGERTPQKDKLWYPKKIYEDSTGDFWIAEPQSVSKWDGQTLKRYSFGEEDNSVNFIRSFQFAELNNNQLFLASYPGHFFLYDSETDSLARIETNKRIEGLNHMVVWRGFLWIAATNGLFCGEYDEASQSLIFTEVGNHEELSYLEVLSDTEMIMGTFQSRLFKIHFRNEAFDVETIGADYSVINHIFSDANKTIYLSTERGINILTPKQVITPKMPKENIFIEFIVRDPATGIVYCASKDQLYHVDMDNVVMKYEGNESTYFLASTFIGNQLWMSSQSQFQVYENGEVSTKYDFSEYGRYIFQIAKDYENKIWFSQEVSIGLKRLDPTTGDLEIYDGSKGIDKEIFVVKTTEEGVFGLSHDPTHYLFFKRWEEDSFTDISIPFEEFTEGVFRIEDMYKDGDKIWLATSKGIYYIEGEKLHRLDLPANVSNSYVSSLIMHENELWFGNSFGLFRYDVNNETIYHFDESVGLPSNSVPTDGLRIYDDQIFVSTANGLAVMNISPDRTVKTPKPVILDLQLNGSSAKDKSSWVFPAGSLVGVSYTSLSFPNNDIAYSYRLVGQSEEFSEPFKDTDLSFPGLDYGSYQLEVKAKKIGNFDWSEPLVIPFVIEKAFYQTWVFYIILATIVVGASLFSAQVVKDRGRRREQILEELVNERTEELGTVNKDLQNRNEELDRFVYAASHDLSAPLKSMKGLMHILSVETSEEERTMLMGMVNKSINKLEEFLRELIDYSRNSRKEVVNEPLDFKVLLDDIMHNISYYENYNKIKFHIDLPEDASMTGDPLRMKIIFNNLISNAVKFQHRGSDHQPEVHISMQKHQKKCVFEVKDNGMGIAEEYQKKIYDMFFRITSEVEGSGLGLYILKETVEKLQGKVTLQSQPNKGTSFKIILPAIKA